MAAVIRVAVKQGLVGEGETVWRDVEWRPGTTVRMLKEGVASIITSNVLVGVNGKQLEDDEMVPDGATVVIVAATGYALLVQLGYALVSAIISLGINYAIQALSPTPKPPGIDQQRGENSSPTYAWDAIQTSYGQGLPIAVVLGRHAVGGQVIHSSLRPWEGGQAEILTVVLALCEGPVQRIGQFGGARNRLGGIRPAAAAPTPPLPEGFYINDNLQDATGTIVPDVEVSLRNGRLNQSALPAADFPGASTLFTISQQLADADDEYVWTYSGTDSVDSLRVMFRAPGGLYQVTAGGAAVGYPVAFEIRWRFVGETVWRVPAGGAFISGSGGATQSFGSIVTLQGVGEVNGPFQVQVRRTTPSGDVTNVISQTLLRSIELIRPQEFAYPGIALLGVAIKANGAVSGSLPRFKVRVDGVLVRVWDAVHGFSEPAFDPPGGDFSFCTMAGTNPAWLLGEYATNTRWGMGNELGDDKVDWPALRRWAAYCQAFPVNWNEVRYTCNLVLDAQRPAWETVMAICSAGRAAPIWKAGKLSVVYQYRDEHGDSGITVPAKVPVQLITSALCTDVQVRWLERKGRATALDFQFLDEEQGYAQNVVTVEDGEASINDPSDPNSEPYINETVQAYGVTRRSQLVRQGVFMHRTSRLVRRELTFTCGPWMLAAEVGELIDFQHDLLKPFDGESTIVMQVAGDVREDTRVLVDHKVSGKAEDLQFAARLPDGTPLYRGVELYEPTTYRGRPATLLHLSGDVVTIDAGASCAIGLADKIVQTYQIVAISLAQDMRRVVRCLQWVPEVYDPVPLEAGDLGQVEGKLTQRSVDPEDVLADDVTLERRGDGGIEIAWSRPTEATGTRARVYARQDDRAVWVLVGETELESIVFPWPVGWSRATVSVVLENTAGAFAVPEMGSQAAVDIPEFPPVLLPAPGAVSAQSAADQNRLDLSWAKVPSADVVGYEVRVGDDWAAGKTVYRGADAGVSLLPAPGYGRLQIAAVHRSGLFGRRAVVDVAVDAVPYAGGLVVDATEFAPTNAGGTHSSTVFDGAEQRLELAAGAYQGTFTSTEIDLGFTAPFFLRVAISARELDGATVDDLAELRVGSGEAFWRTVDTRPASPRAPGINWSLTLDDIADTPVDQLEDLLASGLQRGEAGSHVRCDVESRVYADGAWTDWAPHQDRTAKCSRWQARLLLGRTALQREIRVETFRLEALI